MITRPSKEFNLYTHQSFNFYLIKFDWFGQFGKLLSIRARIGQGRQAPLLVTWPSLLEVPDADKLHAVM